VAMQTASEQREQPPIMIDLEKLKENVERADIDSAPPVSDVDVNSLDLSSREQQLAAEIVILRDFVVLLHSP